MISENIRGAALKLRELAGRVSEPEWEEIRSVVRVLDQAAEDASNFETGVAMCVMAVSVTAEGLAAAEQQPVAAQ